MSRIEQIEQLFHEALALPPEVDLAAWVEECCRDSDMACEVMSLIKAHLEMRDW